MATTPNRGCIPKERVPVLGSLQRGLSSAMAHTCVQTGLWMMTPTHGTTYNWTNNAAPSRDKITKEVNEFTGEDGLPVIPS